ncbi:MAG TPA: superoxide dismutase [Anaerolineaceae bacterium]|nr:superoxide dismutase [Anaerolineaceae bacterium]
MSHHINAKESWMKTPVELPELPWAKDALAPIISEETINFHYGKHHQAYVNKTKELIAGTELEGKSLEEIIIAAEAGKPEKQGLFNNASQIWNHNFYWDCLTPAENSKMPEELAAMFVRDFGSVEEFKKQLVNAGMTQFGSGWAWVVVEDGKLAIGKTPNADNLWTGDKKAVLVLDVWEHAYYLDYQNARKAYLDKVVDTIINWDYMLQNIKKYL